jgi:DNA-binding transcriptional ArsR family regulator
MSDETDRRTGKVNRAMVHASGHPVEFAILRLIWERGSASGPEIAAAVAKPRSTVGDHLRKLQAGGLIECVGEEPKRGTVERVYRATALARGLNDDEIGQVGAAERRRMCLRVVQSVVVDASAALRTNTLDRRDDWCLSSMRVTVDARGWTELAEINRRALEEMEKVLDASDERLEAEPDAERILALGSVILLELPEQI